MKKIFVFLLIWLGWGFTIGTVLLLGPLRWIVDLQRKNLASENIEKGTVVGLIVLLIAVSAIISWVAFKKIMNPASSNVVKKALTYTPVIGFIFCFYVFMNPQWVNGMSHRNEIINNSITIGPYPELEQLLKLKDEGYVGVIALLHPAVVPFEPRLIEQEKENTAEVGLDFVNIPMLPWISENEASIDSLEKFISKPRGKYYLHCYLGRDRVQAAAKIIQQADKNIIAKDFKIATEFANDKLERGPIEQLDKDVFLSPFPTKEEYFHLVPNFEQVVSLHDLKDKDAAERNKEEQSWLAPYKVDLKSFDVDEATSAADMSKIVAQVKTLPKPILIHGFINDSKDVLLFKKMFYNSLGK